MYLTLVSPHEPISPMMANLKCRGLDGLGRTWTRSRGEHQQGPPHAVVHTGRVQGLGTPRGVQFSAHKIKLGGLCPVLSLPRLPMGRELRAGVPCLRQAQLYFPELRTPEGG